MNPDHHAQLKQLDEHALALHIDFDAAQGAGADADYIRLAKKLLEIAVERVKEAIRGKV